MLESHGLAEAALASLDHLSAGAGEGDWLQCARGIADFDLGDSVVGLGNIARVTAAVDGRPAVDGKAPIKDAVIPCRVSLVRVFDCVASRSPVCLLICSRSVFLQEKLFPQPSYLH